MEEKIQTAGEKGKPVVVIEPTRHSGYEARTVTGISVRETGKDAFLLEPFIDLPPLRMAKIGEGREAAIVERRIFSGIIMGKDEMRQFGEWLIDAANGKHTRKP